MICLVTSQQSDAQPKPPKIYGTVNIDQFTLMSYREVTIKEWMAFIVNNHFDNSLFPDSSAIDPTSELVFTDLRKQHNFAYLKIVGNLYRYAGDKTVEPSGDFRKLIFADPNYFSLEIPITGITFEQAQKYCKWKEDMINQNQKIRVEVSLPSVDIYKRVIPNRDTLSKNGKCFELNCSTAKCETSGKDKAHISEGKALENAGSYLPTALGLYNIQGNAAEMTSTYGVAMGGSFRQPARESFNDKFQHYDKACDWLGFRYVITTK